MPNINGIEVEFPHNPYKVQLEFMNKMITAIQNSQNSVLESPTGRFSINYCAIYIETINYLRHWENVESVVLIAGLHPNTKA